jgi:hypothetical protein
MISDAIETCCRSIPSRYIIPKVIASVIGIDNAISTAERHSQKPMSDTSTTRITASFRLPMNRWMFSSTWRG